MLPHNEAAAEDRRERQCMGHSKMKARCTTTKDATTGRTCLYRARALLMVILRLARASFTLITMVTSSTMVAVIHLTRSGPTKRSAFKVKIGISRGGWAASGKEIVM